MRRKNLIDKNVTNLPNRTRKRLIVKGKTINHGAKLNIKDFAISMRSKSSKNIKKIRDVSILGTNPRIRGILIDSSTEWLIMLEEVEVNVDRMIS